MACSAHSPASRLQVAEPRYPALQMIVHTDQLMAVSYLPCNQQSHMCSFDSADWLHLHDIWYNYTGLLCKCASFPQVENQEAHQNGTTCHEPRHSFPCSDPLATPHCCLDLVSSSLLTQPAVKIMPARHHTDNSTAMSEKLRLRKCDLLKH